MEEARSAAPTWLGPSLAAFGFSLAHVGSLVFGALATARLWRDVREVGGGWGAAAWPGAWIVLATALEAALAL